MKYKAHVVLEFDDDDLTDFCNQIGADYPNGFRASDVLDFVHADLDNLSFATGYVDHIEREID